MLATVEKWIPHCCWFKPYGCYLSLACHKSGIYHSVCCPSRFICERVQRIAVVQRKTCHYSQSWVSPKLCKGPSSVEIVYFGGAPKDCWNHTGWQNTECVKTLHRYQTPRLIWWTISNYQSSRASQRILLCLEITLASYSWLSVRRFWFWLRRPSWPVMSRQWPLLFSAPCFRNWDITRFGCCLPCAGEYPQSPW